MSTPWWWLPPARSDFGDAVCAYMKSAIWIGAVFTLYCLLADLARALFDHPLQ